ncbi:MAG: hypothetical protein ACRCV6_00765 [Formosimonas sp.]
MKQIKNLKRSVASLLCASLLWALPVYAEHHHSAAMAQVGQKNEAGQMVVLKGDSLSGLAKEYAKAQQLPFDVAFKGLLVANPQALADKQNNLQVGATFVLPSKEDVLVAARTGVLPTPKAEAVIAAPVASVPVEPAPVLAPPPVDVPLPLPEKEPLVQANSVHVFLQSLPFVLPEWLYTPWGLPLVLSLPIVLLLVWFLRRQARRRALVAHPVTESVVVPEVADESSEEELTEAFEETLPAVMPAHMSERFNQALANLPPESLDLTQPHRPPEPVWNTSSVLPTEQTRKVNGQFFNYSFKTPAQRLRELNVIQLAEAIVHVKVESMQAVQVPPDVLEVETAAAPELNVNMPQFLNAFSRDLPEPDYSSVDYEDLLDKARLQAWLNVHTPEEIIVFAQDAYDARYEDVAQLMLNDVLLRGNANQVTTALNLRHMWSYPKGVS